MESSLQMQGASISFPVAGAILLAGCGSLIERQPVVKGKDADLVMSAIRAAQKNDVARFAQIAGGATYGSTEGPFKQLEMSDLRTGAAPDCHLDAVEGYEEGVQIRWNCDLTTDAGPWLNVTVKDRRITDVRYGIGG